MFKQQIEKINNYLFNNIGIDLGTANTLVYLKGKGIIINEPSVVAINHKTGQVVAVGIEAKRMLGRTPSHISAIKPLVGGVISDFEITEEMISYLIKKAEKGNKKLFGPRVVVGVPSGITNVETRAVRDVTKNNGAREVHIVEQPVAAAIGIRLPIFEPAGNMVIDIGGGTSDIAVISLGGIVSSKSLKIAGDKLNDDIISYIRSEFKILIGEKTAETIKIAIGSVAPGESPVEASIRGRDLITGLPREVVITDADVREAISSSIDNLVEGIKEVLEITPPEIVSDIMHKGIYLVGGGALLKNLDKLVSDYTKITVKIADDPLTAVARGTGIILEDLKKYDEVLIHNE
ncbi:MAG: rod shape-determining protein, partial [Candidatus Paceibacterota bacterium]